IEMKFLGGGDAKFKAAGLLDGLLKGLEYARRVESREREMWRECTLLTRDAKRGERCLDRAGKRGEFRACFDPGPEDVRAALIWEKSQAAKIYGDGSAAGNGRECRLDHFSVFLWCFADEFQRDVKAFDSRPSRVSTRGTQFGGKSRERTTYVFG